MLGRGRPLPACAFAAGFFAGFDDVLALNFKTFLADFFAAALDFAVAGFLRVAIVSSPKSLLRAHHYFLRTKLFGLRLPILPLSLPAAGSIAALISVGLPESMAVSTARLSSSGVVTLTPTPPKASI